MQAIRAISAFSFMVVILCSCKKDDHSSEDCFPGAATARQITDAQATIKQSGGKFYIVELGAIDTRLNPCTLPIEFQINDLQVIVSGDVKATPGVGVCCTENFVITKITK